MRFRITIEPLTAFGSSLLGETLFGQLCWAIRYQQGEARLRELLEGYGEGRPFAAVSDAFPSGYLPLPSLPVSFWEDDPGTDRKVLKGRRWIREEVLKGTAPRAWRNKAVSDADLLRGGAFSAKEVRVHNTISRLSATTGKNEFAPFKSSQTWFAPGMALDIYAETDGRLSEDELRKAFEFVGQSGYGRDASAGLGKFSVCGLEAVPAPAASETVMTLASSFPGAERPKQMWYRVKTHFGRHGGDAALGANPFKQPLLLAERGAVYEFSERKARSVTGRGITGVSLSDPETVHQGCAPVVALPKFTV